MCLCAVLTYYTCPFTTVLQSAYSIITWLKYYVLSNMYIHVEEVSEALHRYLVERCKRSFAFALQVCEIN